jgi:predicted outer membrane repeat protein
MTITDSVVSNNDVDGISNGGNAVSGTASLTVVNSNVSDNAGIGINIAGFEAIASATILSTTVSGNSTGGVESGACFGGAQLTITDCTISGNSTDGGILAGCGTFLTVANSTISDNLSGDNGGGISGITARVSIVNSTISGNSAGTSGGGIYCFENMDVSIVNSTISGNLSGETGGGIYDSGFSDQNASIVNSTISGNSAGTSGAGIYNVGLPLHVANSTISGNSAETSGGGIFNFAGLVEITNCTVSGNSASSGGGIYNSAAQFGAVLQTANTIFNAGASGENIFNDGGTVISDGYNLSSDDGGGYLNGSGDQINTDPMLGALQNNGGPTFTHALSLHSPAINAGDPSFTPPPSYDQRGSPFVRVFNGRIDIGSFEAQPGYRHPTPHPRPTPPR